MEELDMTDREIMEQALEALIKAHPYSNSNKDLDGHSEAIAALRERLAQPEHCQCPECRITPHASDCAVHNEPAYPKGACNCQAQPEQEPANYKELLNKSEARLHEVAVHCERVERRLREVNTAAMKLTSDLTCMEIDDDDRLSRDRVMGRVMQWRNEWDKAMFKEKNT
jgi:ribosome-binding ATPase YchF (GTP1/OBG family)